ncbi:aminoglycoside phosphotransferase family protein [Microlunatus flavus]|uniref:Streptomycin 6-kinase n=1 Tax=Microlunatus flavus TaxID=1036181 RepID=A0A1H9MT86_9ACTN|nr:aminoglycoside phosphotransferase family protein [Microlunatus flavus]SER26914.1 streptomycin 6-kinase [Microlunatus flavus]
MAQESDLFRVRLQPLVRARVAALGPAGQAWVDALPGLLADLAARWSLRLGRGLPGGSASYLVAATRAGGGDAVLKVALPGPGFARVAEALRESAGRGHAAVLEVDEPAGALLLERLGPSLDRSGLGPEEQVEVLARTLAVAWRPPDRAPADKAGSLAEGVRARHVQHPGAADDAVVDRALAHAAQLADHAGTDLVRVHGDPHPGNLLRVPRTRPGAESGWCFVDPEPLVTDRAYDLGVAVRDFSGALLADPGTAAARLRSWCRAVAAPSGTDPERVWAWAYLERVSTGLYVTSFGAPRVAGPFLASAALLLRNS